jgi:nitroreductase
VNVSEAVVTRKSIRAFLPTPVPDATIRNLLAGATRDPSGGNVQPWKVYVVNGESMADLLNYLEGCEPIEEPEYDGYPSGL